MSVNNARKFVAKLREDHSFRNKVLETTGSEDLLLFLQEERLSCNQRELVGAMAECMEQLELQMNG
jgi:predicted ribosomally synthesized peptide with nif11-like leader